MQVPGCERTKPSCNSIMSLQIFKRLSRCAGGGTGSSARWIAAALLCTALFASWRRW